LRAWKIPPIARLSPKYSTADTQIRATMGKILKVAVSGVFFFVSAVLMGSPLVFGDICPRISALFGCICPRI
jgi:hypothetical protein